MEAFFTRIRVRILGIVLLAIVPAIALMFYSAGERKHQVSAEIENNALRLSRFLASNLERDLSEGRGFLDASSELLGYENLSPGDCRPQLSRLLGDSSVYVNIGLAGPDGKVNCSSSPLPSDIDLKKMDWFQDIASKPGFVVGFDFSGKLSREASIILARPVSLKHNAPHPAFLFAVMDLDWLNTLASKAQLPRGYAIGVTNRDGDALARYPDPGKWVGKTYPRAHALANDLSENGVKLAEGIDGVKRIYAYSKVHGKGDLVVHVGIRREEVYAPANRALAGQLLALGAVGILAIMAAWFGSDVFLLKQVRVLIAATKKLASGNLAARSSLSYDKGELGELARAFDEMAETLEWRDAQLRESEIERANPANQLFDFVEVAPEPILIFDDASRIVAANREAAKAFGYGSDDFAGLSFLSLFPPSLQNAPGLESILDSKGPEPSRMYRVKARACHKDGSPVPVEVSLSKSLLGTRTFIIAIALPVEEGKVSA